MKSNEEWSTQSWPKFVQLRKKPEKKSLFIGIWTRDHRTGNTNNKRRLQIVEWVGVKKNYG